MPLVSVVIPTRGRPALLARAVASVLAQTMTDLEIVVVVDGDDPATVARLSAVGDDRLRVCLNPVSVGSGAARNVGADQAMGDWLAFLDDDDEWLPTKLERQLALATSSAENVVVSCRSAYVSPRGTSARPRELYDNRIPVDEWLFDRRRLFGGHSFIQTSSLLVPTALFRRIRFPPHAQHEDWEFVIVAVKSAGARLATAPEILVRHYAEEERASLSASGGLEGSLAWLLGVRKLVTKRAFSGFCLTIVAHRAKRVGTWRAFSEPLDLAFRYGRPTLLQLVVFFMVWGMPTSLHLALRRLRPAAVPQGRSGIAPGAGPLAS